jgi:hypothetical protein
MEKIIGIERGVQRSGDSIVAKEMLDRLHAEIRKQQLSNGFGSDEIINTLVDISRDFKNICNKTGVSYGKC